MKPQNPRHRAPRESALSRIESAMKDRKAKGQKSPYQVKLALRIGIKV